MVKRDYAAFVKVLLYFWAITIPIHILSDIIKASIPFTHVSTFSIVVYLIVNILDLIGVILILRRKFIGLALVFLASLFEIIVCLFVKYPFENIVGAIGRVVLISLILLIRKDKISGWSLLLHDLKQTRKRIKNKRIKAINKEESVNSNLLVENTSIQEGSLSEDDITTDIESQTQSEELIPEKSIKETSDCDLKRIESSFIEETIVEEPKQINHNMFEEPLSSKGKESKNEKGTKSRSNKERLLVGVIVLLFLLLVGSICFTLSNHNNAKNASEQQINKNKGIIAWDFYSVQGDNEDYIDMKKNLYNALSEEYDLGTFENYCSKLDIEENRKHLYDVVHEDYNVGVYDYYLAKLGYRNSERWSIISDSYDWYKKRYGNDAGTFERFAEINHKDSVWMHDLYNDLKTSGTLSKDWSFKQYKFIYNEDYKHYLYWESLSVHDYIKKTYNCYKERYGDAANTFERFSKRIAEEADIRKIIYNDLKKYGDLNDTWNYDDFSYVIKDEFYYLIRPSSEYQKYEITNGEYPDVSTYEDSYNRLMESSPTTEKDPIVYISSSKGAYAYHKKMDCERLQSSRTISKIPLSEALLLKRQPCSICYKQSFFEKNRWIIIISVILLMSIILNIYLWTRKKRNNNYHL